jgi:Cu(I)/Ag(I) efflux system membrane fusion protein
VLALGGGSFKSIAVTVGRFDNESVEILTGLVDGEEVVSSAQFLLDSESSKSSDFMRMNHDSTIVGEDISGSMMTMDTPMLVSSASTTGIINSVMTDNHMVNISRGAIEKWQRPAATLDFVVDEGLKVEHLKKDDEIEFTFEIRGDDFVITELVVLESEMQE